MVQNYLPLIKSTVKIKTYIIVYYITYYIIFKYLRVTAKANGIDFYQYLVKLFTNLPNLPIHQQPNIFKDYISWSKNIQVTCAK